MSARRSIRVARVLRMANIGLGRPDASLDATLASLTPHQAYRLALASLVSNVLHETGNYAGFGYQEFGQPTDETRRVYYVHSRIKADYEALQQRNHVE